MVHISRVIHTLLEMLQSGRISLAEYERRVRDEADRQQSLQLGIGAPTEPSGRPTERTA